jgi:hypothetical protein
MDAAIETSPPPVSPEPPSESLAQPQDDAAHALKAQLGVIRQQEAAAQATQRRNDWVQSSPLAQQHYAALSALHHEAMQSGFADTSPEYFSYLDSRLADLQAQQPTGAENLVAEMQQRAAQVRPQEQPQSKPARPQYSAPVSREVPSAGGFRQSGRVTLTVEDREFARIAGVSDVEYAKQKARLLEMKASGEYSDRR